MTINLSLYKSSRPVVDKWCARRKNENLVNGVSQLASVTFCPAIVVAYWIGDNLGWPPEVVECINRLTEFYDYDAIEGKPEGAPV